MTAKKEPPLFADPCWYKALTLSERASCMTGALRNAIESETAREPAGRRFQQWSTQQPFTKDQIFAERLEADRLTRDEFVYLLGESAELLSQRMPERLEWLADIEQAFSDFANSSIKPDSAATDESVTHNPKYFDQGFINIVRPLIMQGCERFNAGTKSLQQRWEKLPFDPNLMVHLFLPDLFQQLWLVTNRTMILELNVARLEKRLEGETATERFKSFCNQLFDPEVALSILQEYPVMARQLVRIIGYWVNNHLQFLTRLCEDWETIKNNLNDGKDPGLLSNVSGGVGDTHRLGHAVMIASFDTGLRVVYKPHSLSVDIHYKELLDWINERGSHPPFRTLTVIDRKTYGWVEFARAHSCSSEDEVRRFYYRQGGYIALLFLLEATDFHLENLIASGEHPVMVDLEALFHPRVESESDLPGYAELAVI